MHKQQCLDTFQNPFVIFSALLVSFKRITKEITRDRLYPRRMEILRNDCKAGHTTYFTLVARLPTPDRSTCMVYIFSRYTRVYYDFDTLEMIQNIRLTYMETRMSKNPRFINVHGRPTRNRCREPLYFIPLRLWLRWWFQLAVVPNVFRVELFKTP